MQIGNIYIKFQKSKYLLLLMFSVEMNYILIYQCGTMIRKEVYFPTYMCMIVVRNLMIIQDI